MADLNFAVVKTDHQNCQILFATQFSSYTVAFSWVMVHYAHVVCTCMYYADYTDEIIRFGCMHHVQKLSNSKTNVGRVLIQLNHHVTLWLTLLTCTITMECCRGCLRLIKASQGREVHTHIKKFMQSLMYTCMKWNLCTNHSSLDTCWHCSSQLMFKLSVYAIDDQRS